jgi:hypothetical protein
MASEDLFKRFEDWMKGKTLVNTPSLEQFDTQVKTSWEQLLKLIQISSTDAIEKTIETTSQGGPNYKTVIKLDGDIKNDFPNPPPEPNNIYWTRHNQLVDQAVALQKEIIIKVMDTVGTIVQKIVSPISISTSDLVSLFRKP